MMSLWWWRTFVWALRARHVDHEARYWWYSEVVFRLEALSEAIRPRSRFNCSDCRRPYKRWWIRLNHGGCDDLPF